MEKIKKITSKELGITQLHKGQCDQVDKLVSPNRLEQRCG
jgi:hypothetical protein